MSKEGVKVVIMDREFTVACKKSEKDDLLEAAAVPSLFLILIASIFIIISSKYILRDHNE